MTICGEVRSTIEAINKIAPVAVARETFIAACLEAGLPTTALRPVVGKTSKVGGVHSPSQ